MEDSIQLDLCHIGYLCAAEPYPAWLRYRLQRPRVTVHTRTHEHLHAQYRLRSLEAYPRRSPSSSAMESGQVWTGGQRVRVLVQRFHLRLLLLPAVTSSRPGGRELGSAHLGWRYYYCCRHVCSPRADSLHCTRGFR